MGSSRRIALVMLFAGATFLDDLLRLRPRLASNDLIMCRNTVIYFAEPIREAS